MHSIFSSADGAQQQRQCRGRGIQEEHGSFMILYGDGSARKGPDHIGENRQSWN